MLEAVSFSEMLVNIYHTHGKTTQKTVIFILAECEITNSMGSVIYLKLLLLFLALDEDWCKNILGRQQILK
jgi:hypothetical protein